MSISKLLLESSSGKSSIFSAGCDKIAATLLANYNKNDTFYIFYDLSPNNKETVDGYTNLVEFVECYDNVYVFPIICIEYIVLKILDRYNCLLPNKNTKDLVDGIIKDFDWDKVSTQHKMDTYIGSSLEHACKHILNSQRMRCMLNVNTLESNNTVNGKYYLSNCDCDRKFCKLNCCDSRTLKAERLTLTLPICHVNDVNQYALWYSLGIVVNNTSIVEVLENIQTFYNKICDSMKLERVIL